MVDSYEHAYEPSDSIKDEIITKSELISASQKVLCSIELAYIFVSLFNYKFADFSEETGVLKAKYASQVLRRTPAYNILSPIYYYRNLRKG